MVFTLRTGVYLHTAYAQASDGSVGFSTESATDAAYLGQYTDASATDATDPSRYTWTPIDLGEGAELVEEAGEEVDDGAEGLIDLLDRELYDTGQFAPDAQATGDRKVQTYFQPDEPDPEAYVFGVGDLWQDTDDGNHLYRWDGTAWVDAQDGGIGAATELAQAADTKATAADSKAQAADDKATAADKKAQTANATAQAVQTALNGLTKVQDGKVLIDGDKVYLSAAFVRSIFAQDITATGTITGAKLIGAILSGNAIDIQAVIDATSIGLKTELVDNSYCLVLSTAAGTTKSNITLSRGSLKLVGQSLLSLDTQELAVNANSIQFAVAEGSYCPYYKAGDKLSGKWKGGGYVTTAKKEVVFTVPLAKPIVGNPTITVAASLIIRQASKYTHGSASSTKVTPKSYEVERGIGDAICITCVMSDLTNAVNNDACAVSADLTITFS